MELTGTIHLIGQTEQVTEKFKKRDLVIKDDSNSAYPQYIKFEAHKDKVSLLDNLTCGKSATVHFNIQGRESKGNYYNTLQIWKIES